MSNRSPTSHTTTVFDSDLQLWYRNGLRVAFKFWNFSPLLWMHALAGCSPPSSLTHQSCAACLFSVQPPYLFLHLWHGASLFRLSSFLPSFSDAPCGSLSIELCPDFVLLSVLRVRTLACAFPSFSSSHRPCSLLPYFPLAVSVPSRSVCFLYRGAFRLGHYLLPSLFAFRLAPMLLLPGTLSSSSRSHNRPTHSFPFSCCLNPWTLRYATALTVTSLGRTVEWRS